MGEKKTAIDTGWRNSQAKSFAIGSTAYGPRTEAMIDATFNLMQFTERLSRLESEMTRKPLEHDPAWPWQKLITMNYAEITFKEFRALMQKRNRTVDDLVDLFRGKMEDSRRFFEWVMNCQWREPQTGRYDDRSDVVIPYRTVIEFYQLEFRYLKDSEDEERQRALQRKRGPVSEEQREILRRRLEKARAAKVRDGQKSPIWSAKSLKKLCEGLPDGYLTLNRANSANLRL